MRTDLSYPNYVRVRIMLPLANALVASTNVRIRGRSDMEVIMWREMLGWERSALVWSCVLPL
jgi:hypothetical protein